MPTSIPTGSQLATELSRRLDYRLSDETNELLPALNNALRTISQIGTLKHLMKSASISLSQSGSLYSGALPSDIDLGKNTKAYYNDKELIETSLDELLRMKSDYVSYSIYFAMDTANIYTVGISSIILYYQRLINDLTSSGAVDMPATWAYLPVDVAEYEQKAILRVVGWEEARVRAMERLKLFARTYCVDKKEINWNDILTLSGQ